MNEPAMSDVEAPFDPEEWRNSALRAMAELDNYRKRMNKQLELARDRVEAETIQKFLDLADDMRRMIDAFKTARGPSMRKQMLDGAQLVFARFMNILEGMGTTGFQSQGQRFAAERMEAIAKTPTSTLPPGTVVDELAQGFTRHGRLLRPAKVVVAALPEGTNDDK